MARIQRRAPASASRIDRTDSAHTALKALLADIKGAQGEALVRQRLDRLGVIALHDINLPNAAGTGTTQIDHLVRLPAALMVIETKHFAGRISGHPSDQHWRQRLGTETEGRLIYSPVQQNAGHCAAVRALCTAIRLDISVLNRVVLTGEATLSEALTDCASSLTELEREISSAGGQPALPDLARIWERIVAASRRSR